MKTFWALLMLACVLSIGALAVTMHPSMPPQEAMAQSATHPALTVLASQIRRATDMYLEAEGEVLNNTNEPLHNIKAHVSYYTKDGTFVTSDSALIAYNPLLPGQRSPFKVLTTWNPAMTGGRIGFTNLWGTPIPSQEAPQATPPTQRVRTPTPSQEKREALQRETQRQIERLRQRLGGVQ